MEFLAGLLTGLLTEFLFGPGGISHDSSNAQPPKPTTPSDPEAVGIAEIRVWIRDREDIKYRGELISFQLEDETQYIEGASTIWATLEHTGRRTFALEMKDTSRVR